jgi:hypothetical protein
VSWPTQVYETGVKPQTIKDYYIDTYLKIDVLLLADVFERFRADCMTGYKLDPVHYLSAPQLSWDAMLKMTGTTLELITDPDLYAWFERGIRGGICMISHRHALANNKYMKDYDASKPSSYIMYGDANNLYGEAMSHALPVGKFQDVVPTLENLHNALALDLEGPVGHTVEVDLEYPKELHDLHNAYPLAPERMTVEDSMLSSYAERLGETLGGTSAPKLVPHLGMRSGYVTDIRYLKMCLDHGLKVSAVKRIVRYEQRAFIQPYIDYNTCQRQTSTNDASKNFFKLMNNACYGKTMESVRDRREVHFITKESNVGIYTRLDRDPAFTILDENMVLVHRSRNKVKLNKPIFCGVSVLDLSKKLMAEFHYDVMMPRYGPERCRLLMTDTDSLVYHIQTEDVYDDIKSVADLWDLSVYKDTRPELYDAKNKAVLGKMKDEAEGNIIREFVGLRPKMYAFSIEKGNGKIDHKRRAKGVSRGVAAGFKVDDYRDILQSGSRNYVTQCTLRSKQHNIQMIEQTKVGLSAYDDKRYLLPDGVTSLAYGHWRISEPSK